MEKQENGFNGAAFFQSGKSPVNDGVLGGEAQLQWSRFFSKRKMSLLRSSFCALRPLQWSRFFSKRKIGTDSGQPDKPAGASMEPLFFKAENQVEHTALVAVMPPASMEPLFFKAENFKVTRKGGLFTSRFNGAAFFQSGKCAGWRDLHPGEWHGASMEPLFFKAENPALEGDCRRQSGASMEPLFFKAEN